MTINYSWAYVPTDKTYKSTYEILRTLIEVVSRGGNLLLNVGPKPDGSLAEEEAKTLEDLAIWMKTNIASIENVLPGLEDWQYYGPSTRRGEIIYLHNFAEPQVSVVVRGVKVARLKSAKVLGSNDELSFTRRTAINDAHDSDPDGEIIIDVRGGKVSGLMPVIVLDFGGDPASVSIRNW
jgi:alpha-L-fucosidase